MQWSDTTVSDREYLEYHGSTIVERVLVVNGIAPQRDWLLFNTVEEAQEFYNENRATGERMDWGRRC